MAALAQSFLAFFSLVYTLTTLKMKISSERFYFFLCYIFIIMGDEPKGREFLFRKFLKVRA